MSQDLFIPPSGKGAQLDRPYNPLKLENDTKDRIRLLSLAPGSFEDPIQITLSAHTVDQLPSYEALSYVWGEKICKKPAQVDGCKLDITKNLDVALRHLRHRNDNRVLWVDAICVDQGNVDERNHQVQLMKLIYSRAPQVVVWLGPAGDNSDFVLDYMTCDEKDASAEPRFVYDFYKLLTRAWFSRVWVVQEVVLAADAIIQCGNKHLSLSTFFQVIHDQMNKLSHMNTHTDPSVLPGGWYEQMVSFHKENFFFEGEEKQRSWIRALYGSYMRQCYEISCLNKLRNGQYRGNFSHLYHFTWRHCATDPRDKVFSLLGMYQDPGDQKASSLPCRIVADYAKSTASVFSEAMAVIISEGFRFGYPRLPLRVQEVRSVQNLPSWVPALSLGRVERAPSGISMGMTIQPDDPTALRPNSKSLRNAIRYSKKIHQKNAFTDDFHVLRAQGIAMGVVTASYALKVAGSGGKSTLKDCREKFMGLLRSFFLQKDVSIRTIFMALLGAALQIGGFQISEESLLLFEALYKAECELSIIDESIAEPLWDNLAYSAEGRTIFVTDAGQVGLSIGELEEGDLLAGLFGFMYPFILRITEAGTYTMVNVARVADHKLGHTCDCPDRGEKEAGRK
jgi:hypothetical protein